MKKKIKLKHYLILIINKKNMSIINKKNIFKFIYLCYNLKEPIKTL